MAIIGTLPNNITNGQALDANPVMADFNFIVNQVNANANPIGTLTAPAGTRAVFQQASAPTGWTTDASATFTDAAMRFNNTGTGSGGSVLWSSWNFGGTFALNPFALSVAQLPPHNHGVNDPTHNHGVSDPGHVHSINPGAFNFNASAGSSNVFALTGSTNTQAAATGISISAAATGITTQNTGSGSTITPTFNTPQVKYADCTVGVKS